jgi:pyridinium-3,5-biscarboxylic acid mononucleotide synthase
VDFRMDWDRERRTGVPEAVLCERKSAEQIGAIIAAARAEDRSLFLTRLSAALFSALAPDVADLLDYDPLSSTAILGAMGGTGETLIEGAIGVVAAGTSDLPVAREAMRALAFRGHAAPIIADVGVAGLWRLMEQIEKIRRFKVVIAVAGMEGALFGVLAGLVAAPVIAVPTSVGYGVAEGGVVALHAALASCVPGLVVVNIDNGFGAAAAALKMLGALPAPRTAPEC